MKELTNKIGGVSTEGKDKLNVETKPIEYRGLNLTESTIYAGGTSIRYWM